MGGAEQVVISLARGLDKSCFRPFIACLNDEGRFAEELKKEGIEVFSLNKVKGIDFSVVLKLVKIIRENDIQIIHTHLWGANFWGRFAANAAKVPVIVTEHNVDVWKTPFHFLIDRWLLGRTDRFIAVSETVRSFYARKLGVSKDRMKVVYNGIKITDYGRQTTEDRRKILKEEFGIKEGERVIAVIGRLVLQKGHAFFLDALSRSDLDNRGRGRTSGYKVLIVGDGPLKNSLSSIVNSLSLDDKVIFTGFRKDVQEILGITDILVLPSSREGLPMVILEAMVAGVIVVATAVGGTPELVEDGVNGFLVEYGDVEGLKKKLEDIVNADSSRLNEVRQAARKTVEEKFSLEKMVAEHEGIYKELTSSRVTSSTS